MNSTKSKERLQYIDAMKGISILLVVADHCGFVLPCTLDYIEVPAFFIISGFLYNAEPFKILIKKKIHRLVIPYLFFSLIYILPYSIKLYTDGFSIHASDTIKFIFNLFCYPANAPLWFLKALLWIYLFMSAINLIVKRFMKQQKILLIALSVIFLFIGKYYNPYSYSLLTVTGVWQAIVSFPLFGIGVCFQNFKWMRCDIKVTYKNILLLLSISILYYICTNSSLKLHMGTYDASVTAFVLSSAIGFILLSMLTRLPESNRYFSCFGKNSLIILGIHLPIITTLKICGVENIFILLIITLILLPPCIKLLKKYSPRLCGM